MKQVPVYPYKIISEHLYFDGIVTWDLMNTTDEFYNAILQKMVLSDNKGVFVTRQFTANMVWMLVDEYIDDQIKILKYDDPQRFAVDLAMAGVSHEDYLDDPDYDPFLGFEMSANADIVQSIVNGIASGESTIPVGILVYDKKGDVSDFQEGRHRSLALHIMGIPYLPVWEFRAIGNRHETINFWYDTLNELHHEGLQTVVDPGD